MRRHRHPDCFDHPFSAGGRFFRGGRPPVPPGGGVPPVPPGPPGAPPFPPFGPGMNPWVAMFRGRRRARRGDVRFAILTVIGEQPRNGYQIMQELEQKSRGLWRPSPGSVYPALQQLEDEGLVRVDTTDGGRVYHLTDAGKKAIADRDDDDAAPPWPWAAVVGDGRAELMHAIRQLMAAAGQVAQAGTTAQLAAANDIVREARRALYRILAEDDAAPGDADADADADGADDGDDE
jgi:DNA-binding PadR family transcriptional regulator